MCSRNKGLDSMNRQMKNRKQRLIMKRRLTVIAATLCIIIGCGIVFGSFFAKAQDETTKEETSYKYYKSIVIETGDTLWNIAQEYKSADCSTEEYIKEVMELNSLSTNKIQEGQHLMIAYYDNEFK